MVPWCAELDKLTCLKKKTKYFKNSQIWHISLVPWCASALDISNYSMSNCYNYHNQWLLTHVFIKLTPHFKFFFYYSSIYDIFLSLKKKKWYTKKKQTILIQYQNKTKQCLVLDLKKCEKVQTNFWLHSRKSQIWL